jgi:molybdopterin-containing oxidoreductase family iron-sulfur binding subunit
MWIWKAPYEHVFAIEHKEYRLIADYLKGKPTMTLCNHCDEPPCVRVCPTKATFKREADGIVMMDYHRCIGCRFCMAACPYGSRSFNYVDPQKHLDLDSLQNHFPTRTKGVVEKCNFCAERLANGQIPACVEACRKEGEGALVFGDLNDPNSKVNELIRKNHTIRRKPELGTMPMVYYIV